MNESCPAFICHVFTINSRIRISTKKKKPYKDLDKKEEASKV